MWGVYLLYLCVSLSLPWIVGVHTVFPSLLPVSACQLFRWPFSSLVDPTAVQLTHQLLSWFVTAFELICQLAKELVRQLIYIIHQLSDCHMSNEHHAGSPCNVILKTFPPARHFVRPLIQSSLIASSLSRETHFTVLDKIAIWDLCPYGRCLFLDDREQMNIFSNTSFALST